MLEQAGLSLEVQFAPYHQIFQQLLAENSSLIRNTQGVNVALIRMEDFIRDSSDEVSALAIINRTKTELQSALASFAARAKVTTIVIILPPSPRADQFKDAIEEANRILLQQIDSLPALVSPFKRGASSYFCRSIV